MTTNKKKCQFCGKNVNDMLKHYRTHNVSSNSGFLIKFYKVGDTLLDIKRKIINTKGARKTYQNIKNKEECFRHMVRDYKRIRSQFNHKHSKLQNTNHQISESLSTTCIFCNRNYSNLLRHFKSHDLNKFSSYLLRYYKEGDTFNELQYKILKMNDRSRINFNRITNKRKAYQQMLIDIQRIKNESDNKTNKNEKIVDQNCETFNVYKIDKQCIICKVNVLNVFKHLKEHGIEDSSAFLLTFYEDGDSLQDIQNIIDQKKGKTKNLFYKFLNEESFQQMLLDYKRIKNEFDDTKNKHRTLRNSIESKTLGNNNKGGIEENKNKKIVDNNSNVFDINKIDKPCIICKVNVKKVFQHLKTHGIEDSSAFLLTFYEDGYSLFDIKNELENMDISKSFYYQFVNKEKFQRMLLDYKRIKTEYEDQNNTTLKIFNDKISLNSNNFTDIINDFKQTINGLITCINKSQHIVQEKARTVGTQTYARSIVKDAKSQTLQCIQKDSETQVFQKELKNVETQTELVEDRPTASSDILYPDRFLGSDKQITLESSVRTKEQRLFDLEEEIRKMREELERISGQDKKLVDRMLSPSHILSDDEMILPGHNTQANCIPKCAVRVEEETVKKLKTYDSMGVSTRKGRSGGLSPLATPQEKTQSVTQDKVPNTRKTRESGRSLDIRKGKFESSVKSPFDNKVARISNEISSSSANTDTQIELRNHQIVPVVNNQQNLLETNLNGIKMEPIDKSDSSSLVKVNPGCWCSVLDDALFPVASAETKHKSTAAIKMLEKVFQNLKLCLGYFLPPEWPVNKAAIRLLSPKELADFPLEKFFDKYKQGLRKLFTNFQSETAKSNEKLCNLRKNVLLVLPKLNKSVDIRSLLGDDIDRSLNDFLSSKT